MQGKSPSDVGDSMKERQRPSLPSPATLDEKMGSISNQTTRYSLPESSAEQATEKTQSIPHYPSKKDSKIHSSMDSAGSVSPSPFPIRNASFYGSQNMVTGQSIYSSPPMRNTFVSQGSFYNNSLCQSNSTLAESMKVNRREVVHPNQSTFSILPQQNKLIPQQYIDETIRLLSTIVRVSQLS